MSGGLDAEQIEMWEYWERHPSGKKEVRVSKLPSEFAKTMGQTPNVERSASLIKEEYLEWVYAFGSENKLEEIKELADLLYVIYGYADARGWDMEEAVRRVHENNLGRCIQPDGSIKRREDGKILKNKDYPKVFLEDLL
jgi:NTP pyrophosphatase (non-canonical NTP hydrolase)